MRFPNPFKFFVAIWRWLRSGGEFVSFRKEQKRLAVCKQCPFYDRRIQQCDVCTCFVPLKVKLKTEDCPYGYW